MAFGPTFAGAPFGFGDAVQQQEAPVLTPIVTGVVVTPLGVILANGEPRQFFAEVLGVNGPSQAVTWTTTLGEVSVEGWVTPPDAGAIDQVGRVIATSVEDPTKSNYATFSVPALNIDPGPDPVDPVDPDPDPVTPPPLDARFARPWRDISRNGWTASAGADLYRMLDGIKADDTYIMGNAGADCELNLGPVRDPNTSINQVMRYEAHAPEGGALTVSLMQGDMLIAQWMHSSLPAVPTVHEQRLTPEQCDSITDYADLRISLLAG